MNGLTFLDLACVSNGITHARASQRSTASIVPCQSPSAGEAPSAVEAPLVEDTNIPCHWTNPSASTQPASALRGNTGANPPGS